MKCKDCGDEIPESPYKIHCMGCYRKRQAQMCSIDYYRRTKKKKNEKSIK